MTQSIMIIGATGSGKTKIAFELARRNHGEVVNLDRAYLYRHFDKVTGLQDSLKEKGVKRHLYELLEPDEPSFSNDHFVQMVSETIDSVVNQKVLAIAEGASTAYVPALLGDNPRTRLFSHIIGIRCPLTPGYIDLYRNRIDRAFEEGIVEEISNNLDRYINSYLIQQCHAGIPIFNYIKGEMTLEQAKEEILNRSLDYRIRQVKLFESYSNIEWIEPQDLLAAVEAIEGKIQRKR